LLVVRLLLFLSRHKNKISRSLLHIYLFNYWRLIIAVGEQSSLEGAVNLPESSNQNISNYFSLFSHRIRVVSKKASRKVSARIISHLPEYFQICPKFILSVVGGKCPHGLPSPTPMRLMNQ